MPDARRQPLKNNIRRRGEQNENTNKRGIAHRTANK